jgi:hypothetical protein
LILTSQGTDVVEDERSGVPKQFQQVMGKQLGIYKEEGADADEESAEKGKARAKL